MSTGIVVAFNAFEELREIFVVFIFNDCFFNEEVTSSQKYLLLLIQLFSILWGYYARRRAEMNVLGLGFLFCCSLVLNFEEGSAGEQ